MRNLKKNETKLWYSNYGKGNPILDENGDETGDYDSGYGSPVSFFATLSASKGNAYSDVFGTNLDYTRTLPVMVMEREMRQKKLMKKFQLLLKNRL